MTQAFVAAKGKAPLSILFANIILFVKEKTQLLASFSFSGYSSKRLAFSTTKYGETSTNFKHQLHYAGQGVIPDTFHAI